RRRNTAASHDEPYRLGLAWQDRLLLGRAQPDRSRLDIFPSPRTKGTFFSLPFYFYHQIANISSRVSHTPNSTCSSRTRSQPASSSQSRSTRIARTTWSSSPTTRPTT